MIGCTQPSCLGGVVRTISAVSIKRHSCGAMNLGAQAQTECFACEFDEQNGHGNTNRPPESAKCKALMCNLHTKVCSPNLHPCTFRYISMQRPSYTHRLCRQVEPWTTGVPLSIHSCYPPKSNTGKRQHGIRGSTRPCLEEGDDKIGQHRVLTSSNRVRNRCLEALQLQKQGQYHK